MFYEKPCRQQKNNHSKFMLMQQSRAKDVTTSQQLEGFYFDYYVFGSVLFAKRKYKRFLRKNLVRETFYASW